MSPAVVGRRAGSRSIARATIARTGPGTLAGNGGSAGAPSPVAWVGRVPVTASRNSTPAAHRSERASERASCSGDM